MASVTNDKENLRIKKILKVTETSNFPRDGERERDREMGREREREQERAAESNAKRLVSGTPFHPYCYIPPGQPSPLPPPVPSGGADVGAYGPTP